MVKTFVVSQLCSNHTCLTVLDTHVSLLLFLKDSFLFLGSLSFWLLVILMFSPLLVNGPTDSHRYRSLRGGSTSGTDAQEGGKFFNVR